MHKKFTSLGLMSGTSGDGVDASIINSNGTNEFDVIKKISILNTILKFIKKYIH